MEMIQILLTLPIRAYVSLIGIFTLINLVIISPILYHLWIVPSINDRYGIELREVCTAPIYKLFPWLKWGTPSLDVSVYIVAKYFNLKKLPPLRNPQPGTIFFKLNEINYKLEDISKAEIIFAFLNVACLIYFIFSAIYYLV